MSDLSELTFDALKPGDQFALGSFLLTREDIIAFASPYDPQPQHLHDAGAAANPVFDRLSASGWHTAVIMNKLVGPFFERTAIRGLAGAGVEQLRWIEPVYEGDTLDVSMKIAAIRPSQSNPERGLITMLLEARNQADRPKATLLLTGVFERRPRGT